MRLAWELGDEDLARQLLEPFAIEAVAPTDAVGLVSLAEQHGHEWFEGPLSTWLDGRRASIASPTPTRASWAECLPDLCAHLGADPHAPGGPGTKLARTLTIRVADWLTITVAQVAATTTPSLRQASLRALATPTLAVLRSAGIVDDPRLRDRIIGAICEPTLRTKAMLVDVMHASAALPPADRDAIGVSAIAHHCRRALEAELARPPRADDDWSITEFESGHCCDDCTTLTDFLSDPKTRQIIWPLAKPRRQHIHQRIDEAELPVSHHTTRQGSPHKLVLTKSPDLHLRETARDRATTKSLDLVQQYLNSIV